jgi:hypothetical protein
MKTQSFVGYIVAAVILAVSQAQAAGLPPDPTSLLIRYRVVSTESLTEITSTFDGFIFRDGLVVEHHFNDTGECSVVRASALPEKLSRLKTALGVNRVDIQQGNCINEPPGEFSVERQVTWFGRGRRQHSYQYGVGHSFGGVCPSEVQLIDRAITDVFGTATGEQTRQTCP